MKVTKQQLLKLFHVLAESKGKGTLGEGGMTQVEKQNLYEEIVAQQGNELIELKDGLEN